MRDDNPSDRKIRKDLFRMEPELIRRYGRAEGCTLGQLVRTADDLKTSQIVYPYLCAAFLSEEALRGVMAEMPNENWEEIKERAKRIGTEFARRGSPFSDRFYESGIGMSGAD